MAEEERAKHPNFPPGGLQGGWLGLLFLLPLQAGGRNEFLPPPTTAEVPGLEGGGRVQDAAGGSFPWVSLSEVKGYS